MCGSSAAIRYATRRLIRNDPHCSAHAFHYGGRKWTCLDSWAATLTPWWLHSECRFTDSNTRERLPYEADGFITARSRWALQAELAWPSHSIQHVLVNPTWPTEWKQFMIMLIHGEYYCSVWS